MRLPNGSQATIRIEKLTDHALNPEHPVGKRKARLFANPLGITRNDPQPLFLALRDAAANAEATPGKTDCFGTRYTVDFLMSGSRGTFVVTSAWISRGGEPPDLVTCFIL